MSSAPRRFGIYDCALSRRATGRVATNLRDLLESLRRVPPEVIEHHMMRCALEDYFELYEFPNDLAQWAWDSLGDHILGEQLGLVDPYQHASIEALREFLINLIEDHLWDKDRIPWSRPGRELHFIQSKLIAFDTGEEVATPAELTEAIERMSLRSLYFHVHEAHRRTSGQTDDFSLWLEGIHADPFLIGRIRSIDFYFLNLSQLRQELLHAFRQHAAEQYAVGKGFE
ncbi:MAG: DUF5752 family protein [Planctomycetota bacterium]